MARLSDLDPGLGKFLGEMEMPPVGPVPWLTPPPLHDATIAIVSTAGLHRVQDRSFDPGDTSYRVLPGDVNYADIRMSHVSVNFDRSGFQQDVNIAFPLEHLHRLAAAGEIGGVSRWHYSVVGANPPDRLEPATNEIARLLKDDGVDAALLIPV